MQKVSLKLSKKLYEIMPESLKDCENYWVLYRNGWEVSKKQNLVIPGDMVPAPTIENIFDKKFLIDLSYATKPKYGINYLNLMNIYLDGKLPTVENYLWELIGENHD